ncbi:MAG: hypothetical protein ACRBI6_04540 [Acidimicrobiales bacterium]
MENFDQIWPVILMVLSGVIGFIYKRWPTLRKISDVARYVDDVVDALVLEEESSKNTVGVLKHESVKKAALQRLAPVKKLAERAANDTLDKVVDTSIKAAVNRHKLVQGAPIGEATNPLDLSSQGTARER